MKVFELAEWLKHCNQDAEVEISMDVSTGDNDHGNRVFGSVNEVLVCDKYTATLICEETSRNF